MINTGVPVLDGKIISIAIVSVALFVISTVYTIVTSNGIQDIKDSLQTFFNTSVSYDANITKLVESSKLISDNAKALSDKINSSVDDILTLLQKGDYVTDNFIINSLNEIKDRVQAIDKENGVLSTNVAAIMDSTSSSLKNIYKIVNSGR